MFEKERDANKSSLSRFSLQFIRMFRCAFDKRMNCHAKSEWQDKIDRQMKSTRKEERKSNTKINAKHREQVKRSASALLAFRMLFETNVVEIIMRKYKQSMRFTVAKTTRKILWRFVSLKKKNVIQVASTKRWKRQKYINYRWFVDLFAI